MSDQRKLLVLASVWPEPTSSAAGSRMMELLYSFLRRGWRVTYAATAAASEYMPDLEKLGIRCRNIAVNDSSFDDFIASLQPAAVLFDRFMMEEQFGWRVETQCPRALRLLDTEDLHCLRKERHAALKKGQPFTEERLLGSDMARREIASIYRSDLSLMISTYEMDLLQRRFSIDSSLLHHVPFMLSPLTEEQRQLWKPFQQREGFVSIGNFLHDPNWDAVQYMKQKIWPLIRKQNKELNLYIYGAYMPPKAQQLNKPQEGFHVLGRAESASEVIGNARVCLAPLRFGAGIKGKLAEAMLCGTPSVTTSVGAEAMHGDLPWNGAVSDHPEKIAAAALELHENQQFWAKSQQNGVAVINSLYNREQHELALMSRIEDLLNNLDQHRHCNFIGSMMRHHTMKSTQYMSQWIESKNKLQQLQGD